MWKLALQSLLLIAVASLAGCGGGGGNTTASPTIGAGGGTVDGIDGVRVTVPAAALLADATIRIAKDSTGAPAPLPAEVVTPVSNTYALTPHGSAFRQPVTVSLPIEPGQVGADDVLVVLKAQPGGAWQIHTGVRRNGDRVEGEFDGFSYYLVGKLNKTFAAGPFAIQIANGGQAGELAYTISGAMPLCVGGGHYVTSMTDYRDFTVTNGSTINEQLSSYSNVVTVFPVAAAAVAASPRAFVAAYHPTPLPANSSGTGVGGSHYLEHYRTVAGLYKCLAIDGSELSFASNVIYNPPVVVPPPAPAILLDTLQPTTVEVGVPPRLAATVRALTAENLPQAGAYWDKSLDQGATWQQVGFVSALAAVPDPQQPAGTPPALHYTLTLPAATLADHGARLRLRYCTSLALASCTPGGTGPTYGQTFTLTVLAQADPPVFTQPPRSVIVAPGQSASFSVVLTGTPQILLRWQRLAPGASSWTEVATITTNYNTGLLSSLDSGAQYRVVASNAAGETVSAPATLVVSEANIPAAITGQPLSLSVVAGSEAVFAATVRGTEALSYQWRFNGTPILGANSAVIKLPAVSSAAAGSYSIEVTNALGRAVSADAVLTVTPGGSAPPPVAPSIVTQPAAAAVNSGNTATFAVGVAGSGPMTFQWRKDGTAIAGAAAAAYTIAAASAGDAGVYSVQVSNGVGAPVVSAGAPLTVLAAATAVAPTIGTQPATLVVAPGGSATLAVAANGTGPLAFQWRRDGIDVAGATSPVLTLANVNSSSAGRYTVTVSNSAGSVASNAADVILLGAPAITTQPANATTTVGTSATFNVTATGDGLLYQWTRSQVAIVGATSASYTTPALTLADSGAVYGVIVFNGAGLVFSQSAVLTVTAVIAPTVTQQPLDATVADGTPANLDVAFGGTAPFSVQPQRFVSGAWVDHSSAVTVNDNNMIRFSTGNLSAASSPYQFRYVASNASGQATTQIATVTVTPAVIAPAVTQQPLDATVNEGQAAPYDMAFGGTPPFTVQFQRLTGGTWVDYTSAVVWADNGVHRLSTGSLTTAADSGAQFRFVASNASGSVVTNTVTVSFVAAPQAMTKFAYVARNDGTLMAYTIDPVSGALTNGSNLDLGASLRSVTVDPSGKFVYATKNTDQVFAFTINAATGALSAVAGSPYATGAFAIAVAVDPSGRFVYVANYDSHNVSAFAINAASGALTSVGAAMPAGTNPTSVTIDPSGRFAYVTNGGSADVSAYTIDATTGALSAAAGSPFAAGTDPNAVTVEPAGRFAYVANRGSNDVSVFAINPTTGALTSVGAAVGAGTSPQSVTVDPSGRFAYVANLASGDVSGFAIHAATGALTSMGTAVPAGAQPYSVTVEASGKFAYVANFGSANVSAYAIDAGSGVLTALSGSPVAAGAQPISIATTTRATVALVANSGSNTLSILRRNAATGALSSVGTVATGNYPYRIATSPNGRYAYVSNLVGGSISSYRIDANAGVLTPIPLSTPATVNPYGIAVDPLGRFTWVANYSASTVSAFAIDGATGRLAAVGSPVATGTLPYALAAHPSGNYVYVANELGNSVSVFSVNAGTGALTLLAGTIANSVFRPHAIAVDPSGRFVYATESGGSSVAAFRVNAGTGVLSSPTYINTGTSPTAVAVHPGGRFVYVTTSNGVTVFAINSTTGALTAIGSPVAAGSNPAALAIDAAGGHLYVTNLGSNSISAFSIDATTGVLTSLGAAVATGSAPEGVALTR